MPLDLNVKSNIMLEYGQKIDALKCRREFCNKLDYFLNHDTNEEIMLNHGMLTFPYGNIDLHKLFVIVFLNYGGYKIVDEGNKWHTIVTKLYNDEDISLNVEMIDGLNGFIRDIYQKYLLDMDRYLCGPNRNMDLLSLNKIYNFNLEFKKNEENENNNKLLVLFNSMFLKLQMTDDIVILNVLDEFNRLFKHSIICRLFIKYPVMIDELFIPLGLLGKFKKARYPYWYMYLKNISTMWLINKQIFDQIFDDEFNVYTSNNEHYYLCDASLSVMGNGKSSFEFEYSTHLKICEIIYKILTSIDQQISYFKVLAHKTLIIKFAFICIYTQPLTPIYSKNTLSDIAYQHEKNLSDSINIYGWKIIKYISVIWQTQPIQSAIYNPLVFTINRYFEIDPTDITTNQRDIYLNIFAIIENICCTLQNKYDYQYNQNEPNFISNVLNFLFKITPLLHINNLDVTQIFLDCLYTIYKMTFNMPKVCILYSESEDFIRLLGIFLGNLEQKLYSIDNTHQLGDGTLYPSINPNNITRSIHNNVSDSLNIILYKLHRSSNNTNYDDDNHTSDENIKYVPFIITVRELLDNMFELSNDQISIDLMLRAKIKLLLYIILSTHSQSNIDCISNNHVTTKLLHYLNNDFGQFLQICEYIHLECMLNHRNNSPICKHSKNSYSICYSYHFPSDIQQLFECKGQHIQSTKYVPIVGCGKIYSSILECSLRIIRNLCKHSLYGRMLIQIKFWDKLIYHAMILENTVAQDILECFYCNT